VTILVYLVVQVVGLNCMLKKQTKSEIIESIIKGIDTSEYSSKYVNNFLTLLFLKRFSDTFEDEKEKVVKFYLKNGKSKEEANKLSLNSKEYLNSIYVPEIARWSNIKKLNKDIHLKILFICKAIEKSFKEFKISNT